MTNNEEKKDYEAPALTVVTFKAEMGYATSGGVGAARSGYGSANDDGNDQEGNNQTWF